MANLLAKNGKIIGGVPQYNEWKYLGQTVGNAEIEIPAEAEEVICISGFSASWMDFHFLTTMDDINVVRKGYYDSGSNNDVFLFRWTKSTRKASVPSFKAAGTDYTASCITKWYINKPGGVPQGDEYYSTSERKIGKWTDGKDLYETVVDFGALPNNTTKTVAHGISNIAEVTECVTMCTRNDGNVFRPFESFTTVKYYTTKSEVIVITTENLSVYDKSRVILRYTKTT